MRRTLIIAFVLVLTACGQGGGRASRNSAANNEACALIANADAIFGANTDIIGNPGDGAIAADCQFTSADGARSGQVLVFTPTSLGAVTAQAQVATLAQSWDAATETPLAPVENLGDEAQIATGLPGYQTQIVARKGGSVIAVLGSSGDAAMSGEQIARSLAAEAAAHLPAE